MGATIAIVDYGVGNLRSVQKAFAHLGHDAVVTDDACTIQQAARVILPGVGAFGAAARQLRDCGLEPVVLDAAHSGRPFLGICVGMQLLLTESEEMGIHPGLNLIPGRVTRFVPEHRGVKIPQIGWNQLRLTRASPLFARLPDPALVYFVHSYRCVPDDAQFITTETEFCGVYASAVEKNNIYGVQFHPEKSGEIGLQILDNFARLS